MYRCLSSFNFLTVPPLLEYENTTQGGEKVKYIQYVHAWVLFNSATKLSTVSKTSLHRVSISVIHHYSVSCLIYNYRSVWRFSHCRAWCPITSTWQQITKALVIGDSAVLPNTARSSVFSKGRSICCLGQIKCGVIARGGSPECSALASPLTLWYQKVWRGLRAVAHTKYTQRACGSVCVFACAQRHKRQSHFWTWSVRACVRYLETGRLCWSCEARPPG